MEEVVWKFVEKKEKTKLENAQGFCAL